MDMAKASTAFERDGFVVLEGFFEPPVVGELDRITRAHYGLAPGWAHTDEFVGTAEVEVVPWFPQREGSTDFDRIEHDPRLVELTTALLGPGWRADYCMAMHSRAGSAGQAWHQDCPPEDPHRFNLNRLVYTHPIGGRRGGALVVVPGSHRMGPVPPGEPRAPLSGQLVVEVEAGSLILVHGHCWHRVLPVGSEVRISINYRALPAGVDGEPTDVCVYRNMRYRFSTSEIIEHRDGPSS